MPPQREQELFEGHYLTNNLELSDSSDDDPMDYELPLKQFDKHPKADMVFAFHHPEPAYAAEGPSIRPNGKHTVTLLAERSQQVRIFRTTRQDEDFGEYQVYQSALWLSLLADVGIPNKVRQRPSDPVPVITVNDLLDQTSLNQSLLEIVTEH